MKAHSYMEFSANEYTVFVNDPEDGMRILRETSRAMLQEWCEQNCKGRYWIAMGFGKFEEEDDAVLFRLTWT